MAFDEPARAARSAPALPRDTFTVLPSPNPHPPSPVAAALARFHAALAGRFGARLREVVLFGSWARGEAHEDSDVDVLVLVDELDENERREVMDLAYDADAADREAWVGISPLPYSTAQAAELRCRERLLFREIARDGVAL